MNGLIYSVLALSRLLLRQKGLGLRCDTSVCLSATLWVVEHFCAGKQYFLAVDVSRLRKMSS